MEKQIDNFDNLPYYCDFDNLVLISDVIDALIQLKKEVGDVCVRLWKDGIFKNVRMLHIRTTLDGKEKAIEIS